jgi:hypothetical protein
MGRTRPGAIGRYLAAPAPRSASPTRATPQISAINSDASTNLLSFGGIQSGFEMAIFPNSSSRAGQGSMTGKRDKMIAPDKEADPQKRPVDEEPRDKPRRRFTLEELLAGMTPDKKPLFEDDWPVGEELI